MDDPSAPPPSSPLTPERIREFNEASPGLGTLLAQEFHAEIVARRSERQLEQERRHERRMSELDLLKRAQWFSLSALGALLGVTVYAIHMQAPWTAAVLGGGTILGVSIAYLQQHKNTPER